MATSGGAAVSAFTELLQETTPVFLGGDESIVNAATRQTHTLSHIIDPNDKVKMMRMLQGGTDIRDVIYLEKKGAFSNYLLGAEHTYDNPQGKTTWQAPWRMSTGHYSFEDFEVEVNVNGSEEEKILKIKDILYSKQMDAVTSFVEGLDDQFWVPADRSTQEAAGGIDPYPLTAFINEFANGLPAASNQPGGTWTTVLGIDPAAKTNWRCAQQGYSDVGLVSSAGAGDTHLFEAFKRIVLTTEFHGMPYRPDLAEAPTSPGVIFASMLGHSVYERALQMNQDTFVYAGRRSPHYDNAMGYLDYRGIPMVYIQAKDTAAIYPTGAADALGVESSTANNPAGTLTDTAGNNIGWAGPRYEFMNGKYMLKVFHKNRYFYQTPAFRPSERPFTNVVVYDCWHNTICRNRRVQGSVYPILNDWNA